MTVGFKRPNMEAKFFILRMLDLNEEKTRCLSLYHGRLSTVFKLETRRCEVLKKCVHLSGTL